MAESDLHGIWNMLGLMFKAHPWHGVQIGKDAPRLLVCYIEIVPDDQVKFEVDKQNGYLRVDRPQKYSSSSPALYGFVPQTLCAEQVAEFCSEKTGQTGIVGDGDPLDICVLTEKTISHGDVLVQAVPIGGLRVLDGNEADDKIVAVLEGDAVYGQLEELDQCSDAVVDRLKHYFLTYKQVPDGPDDQPIVITGTYGAEEAREVIRRGQQDYTARYAAVQMLLASSGNR
jgi:inorganic pyrophosphatase